MFGAQDIEVMVGALDSQMAAPEQFLRVASVIAHQGFSMDEGSEVDDSGVGKWNDITVLILEDPATGLVTVPLLPPELASRAYKTGNSFIISGFGLTIADDDTSAGPLYKANTPFSHDSQHEIVLGGIGQSDTCQGDSGGPAYVELDGVLYLAGVTSRGVVNTDVSCGDGGVYTKITAYYEWILQQAGDLYIAAEGPVGGDPVGGDDDEYDDDFGCSLTPGESSGGRLPALFMIMLMLCGLSLVRPKSFT